MTTFYYKIQSLILNKLFLHSVLIQYIRAYRCILCIYKHNLVVSTSSEENRICEEGKEAKITKSKNSNFESIRTVLK